MERADALAVLLERRAPLAAAGVELHQPPVRRFVQRVEGEAPLGVLECTRPLAARRVDIGEPVEQHGEVACERARVERLPVVERGAVAEPEAGHEGAAVQGGGLRERRRVIGGGEPPELRDVEPEAAPVEGHRVAVGGEPPLAERRAEGREGAAERRAGALGRVLGPEQRGQRVAAVRAALHRQIGQQRRRLPGVDRERAVPDRRHGRAEEREPQLTVAHVRDRRRDGSVVGSRLVTVGGRRNPARP